jgi:hypothetical protein
MNTDPNAETLGLTMCARHVWFFSFLAAMLLTPVAHAGGVVASVQLMETQGVGGGQSVIMIREGRMTPGGGWAFLIVTSDGIEIQNHYFGNTTGGPGTILRSEATIGKYIQSSLDSFGMSAAGDLVYKAIINDSALTGPNSLWVNDTPFVFEDEPSVIEDMYWDKFEVFNVTTDGEPFVFGNLTSTIGGDVEQGGLFFGTDMTPMIVGGDTIPNIADPLHNFAPISSFVCSAEGTNYMGLARTVNDGFGERTVVMNGEGLILAGTLVYTDNPVPASIGGLPGEEWSGNPILDINDAGDYIMAGGFGNVQDSGYMIKNGLITLREGDVVDGVTLWDNPHYASMNENGDIAFVWRHGLSGPECLFVNDKFIISQGDDVDFNNDGVIDEDRELTNMNGDLYISDRLPGGKVIVVFHGRVQPAGPQERDSILRMEIDLEPDVFSIADFVSSDTFQPPPDGNVDGADLAFLLGEWGINPGSPADIVSNDTFEPPPDGVVDAADLAFLLGEWSP